MSVLCCCFSRKSPLTQPLLSASHGPRVGVLNITVIGGLVKDTDLLGKPDPFVILTLDDLTYQTKVAKKTTKPVWGETFRFEITEPHSQRLKVAVKDQDFKSSDLIGEAEIPIFELPKGKSKQYIQLSKSGGSIEVELIAEGFGNDAATTNTNTIASRGLERNVAPSLPHQLSVDTLWENLLQSPGGNKLHVRIVLLATNPTPNIKSIVKILTNNELSESISVKQLVKFVHEYQKDTSLTERAIGMMVSPDGKEISLKTFLQFLVLQATNGWTRPEHISVFQDMNQNLNHYYCFSSHNTYLTGDQLFSSSSLDAYKSCLKMGCRCVELDCHDGPDNEPIVFHGHTMTGKLHFRTVLDCIKSEGFITSPYPIILSIENHCSEAQQIQMANHLISILGDAVKIDTNLTAKNFSPEGLKGKVILKGPLGLTSQLDSLLHLKIRPWKSSPQAHLDELTRWDTLNLAENVAEGTINDDGLGLQKLLSKTFARIYPHGTRVTSSNMNPVKFWGSGCQIVAINCHHRDHHAKLNEALFSLNGKAGYFLKTPESLGLKPGQDIQVDIQPLFAINLPEAKDEVIDPYVKISIADPVAEIKQLSTKHIQDTTNPEWIDDRLTFVVPRPDIAVLTLWIYDKDKYSADDLVAEAYIPLSSLRSGIRSVPLKDPKSGADFATSALLCDISFKQL